MAAKKKTLTSFRIEKDGDDYRLHIEDDAGEILEFSATEDQLDLIAEALDELLDDDDAG